MTEEQFEAFKTVLMAIEDTELEIFFETEVRSFLFRYISEENELFVKCSLNLEEKQRFNFWEELTLQEKRCCIAIAMVDSADLGPYLHEVC